MGPRTMGNNGVEDGETMSDDQELNINTFESEDESNENSNNEPEDSDCDEENDDEPDNNEEESDEEYFFADRFEENIKEKQIKQVSNIRCKIDQVKNHQNEADQKLCKLVGEKETLLKSMEEKEPLQISEEEKRHYTYILPLVKEIQLLELKVKEKQEKHDQLQLDKEIVKEQSLLLADCLSEEDSILKMWSKQMLECTEQGDDMASAISKLPHINNVSYTAEHCCDTLDEHLAFTVLCQLVHVRVKIKVTSVWPSPLFGHPEAVVLGTKSDTFIPGLSERVVVGFKEKHSASDLLTFVDVFIAEDMAPFAIICPVKKAKKKLKNKDK